MLESLSTTRWKPEQQFPSIADGIKDSNSESETLPEAEQPTQLHNSNWRSGSEEQTRAILTVLRSNAHLHRVTGISFPDCGHSPVGSKAGDNSNDLGAKEYAVMQTVPRLYDNVMARGQPELSDYRAAQARKMRRHRARDTSQNLRIRKSSPQGSIKATAAPPRPMAMSSPKRNCLAGAGAPGCRLPVLLPSRAQGIRSQPPVAHPECGARLRKQAGLIEGNKDSMQ